jgi:hypothetical protein
MSSLQLDVEDVLAVEVQALDELVAGPEEEAIPGLWILLLDEPGTRVILEDTDVTPLYG